MDNRRWKNEYPQMPAAFGLAVEETVAKCLEASQNYEEPGIGVPAVGRKRASLKKWFLLGAAAALLAGAISAGARRTFDFREYMGLAESAAADALFQKDVQAEVAAEAAHLEGMSEESPAHRKPLETSEPLLDIREIMYDGLQLWVYAQSTEAGREFELETLRMEIGGEEVCPVNTENPGAEVYVFAADVSGKNLQAPFPVRQEVRVYKDGTRYENQELLYTVNLENKAEELPDQKFAFADFSVTVSEIRKSPVAVQGLVQVEMTREQKSRYEAAGKNTQAVVRVEGKDGSLWNPLDFSGEEESSVELETLRSRFYCQLPGTEEEQMILRLQEAPEKQDDWRGVAAGQQEAPAYVGEPMEIPLSAS